MLLVPRSYTIVIKLYLLLHTPVTIFMEKSPSLEATSRSVSQEVLVLWNLKSSLSCAQMVANSVHSDQGKSSPHHHTVLINIPSVPYVAQVVYSFHLSPRNLYMHFSSPLMLATCAFNLMFLDLITST
jgi:hypothetical protein